MTEREMRKVIKETMSDLDKRSPLLPKGIRKVLVPSLLGVGLALAVGCASSPAYAAPPPEKIVSDGGNFDGFAPAYAAPMPDTVEKTTPDNNSFDGPAPAYAAPMPDETPDK